MPLSAVTSDASAKLRNEPLETRFPLFAIIACESKISEPLSQPDKFVDKRTQSYALEISRSFASLSPTVFSSYLVASGHTITQEAGYG